MVKSERVTKVVKAADGYRSSLNLAYLALPSVSIMHCSPQFSCSHLPHAHSIHSTPETFSEYNSKHTQHSSVLISVTPTLLCVSWWDFLLGGWLELTLLVHVQESLFCVTFSHWPFSLSFPFSLAFLLFNSPSFPPFQSSFSGVASFFAFLLFCLCHRISTGQ